MEKHAQVILAEAASWNWPVVRAQASGKEGGTYKAIASTLLSCLINESQKLGGEVLDMFWVQVGNCDAKLKDNGGPNLHFHPKSL
jgi:hypothetical protein